ncbi:MAG: zinc-binding dehydrogenase [Thermoplasmata archaeon]|nr:zinc-binding dehydrogenase [Thermoplasmata archaeon]
MIGLGIRAHGGLDRLELLDVPVPDPGPHDVRIRLEAAAFNQLDRFVLAGIPGVPIELPHVLGSDGAGTVDSVGDRVFDLSPRARVLINPGLSDGSCPACRAGQESLCRHFRIVGEHTQGTATRFVVVPRTNVYPIPPALSFGEAAAFPLVFQTAYRALRTIGELRAGERVAIIGGGGGVVTAAIQIAKAAGARVCVTTRSAEKGEKARRLGADEIVVTDDATPLDRALWAWSEKDGVDVILDSVGVATVPRTIRALARGGRLVVIGATTGPVVEIDLRTIFWRQASIRGSTMASRKEFEAVLGDVAHGTLRPVVDHEFAWSDAVEAFRRLEAPDLFGKVVLRAPPDGA